MEYEKCVIEALLNVIEEEERQDQTQEKKIIKNNVSQA